MKKSLRWAMAVVVLWAAGAQAGANWTDDLDKALEKAKKESKHVLVDFSGSDWCGWCKKLDREVFQTHEFKAYARDNLVLVLIDFPRKEKLSKNKAERNAALAQKHDVKGYPTVLLLDPDGKVVGRTGYKEGGGEAYITHLQELIRGARSL